MSARQASKRHAVYIPNMAPHSTKIYEFFGFTPGQTPPLSRIFNSNGCPPEADADAVVHRPDTATTAGFIDIHTAPNGHPINGAAKRPSIPSLPKKRVRKTRKTLRNPFRALVQDFGPIWYLPSSLFIP